MAREPFAEFKRLNNKLALLDLKYTQAHAAGRKLDCVRIIKQYKKIEKRAQIALARFEHQKNLDWTAAVKENNELS